MTGSPKEHGTAGSARILSEKEISRNLFLKGSAGLVVGLTVVGSARASNNPKATLPAHRGVTPTTAAPPDPAQIDSYLEINADNTATLYTGYVELGQGTPTSLRMIAAEELGMTFDQVTLAQVDTNYSLSAVTAGSTATKNSFAATNLRGAAAAARTLLLGVAATRLGVPAGSLSVSNGVISGGGKSINYSDLMAGKSFNATIASAGATLTSPSNYRVVGTRIPRQDIPAIVTGKNVYIHAVRVPGMLHGRVVRPRGQGALGTGATIKTLDLNSVQHIPNVQIVRVQNFLGVVAPHEYDAIQAAAELKVTWDDTPSLPGSGNLNRALRANSNVDGQAPDAYAVQLGNVPTALASAAKVISASYFTPYQGHVPIGPNAAIADVDVKNRTAVVLAATQIPYTARSLVTQGINQALGLLDNSQSANAVAANAANPFLQQNVRVQVFPGSGTYGHSELDDVSIAAAIMSTIVGKPVRVQLMRWDEDGWDQTGPAQATDITAGIDAKGNIVGYKYTSFQHGWMATESSFELAGAKLSPTAPTGSADTTSSASYYDKIPNRWVLSKKVSGYAGFLKGTYLRAPAAPQSLFASEQMIDALAHAANMDPIAFRLQNMTTDPTAGAVGLQGSRWAAVMQAVATAANWKAGVRASSLQSGNVVTGRGFAIGGFSNARPAMIADISVNKKTGKITCTHLYCAMDLGTAINPASVENQMNGGMIMGASRGLFEERRFSKVRQTSLDWASYPIMRFKDAPKVTTIILQRTDQPADGAGEPAEAPVAAAIANAFFDATGVRLYNMPMQPGQVRGALALMATAKAA